MTDRPHDGLADTISIGTRLVGSDGFRALFQDGMALIEEAAAYLDGPGRKESRDLSRTGSLSYATESMRLTTRLMQVASWLLLQRAVHEGEMTAAQARHEKYRVKLETLSSAEGAAQAELPPSLRGLIARSARLQERVRHLDQLFNDEEDTSPANVVVGQIDRLRAAFGER